MEEMTDRLHEVLVNQLGKTVYGISKDIDVSTGIVDNWINGKKSTGYKRSMPNPEYLKLICDFYHINPMYIMYGEGEMFTQEQKKPISKANKVKELQEQIKNKENNGNKSAITYIPVKAQAGMLIGFADKQHVEELPKIVGLPGFDDCDMAITVEGDSMFPSYANGDLVFCKKVEKLDYIRWGEPYLILAVDGAVIKYITNAKKEDTFWFVSENELYRPYEVHKDRIKSIWLIKGKLSKSTGRRSMIEKELIDLKNKINDIENKIAKKK